MKRSMTTALAMLVALGVALPATGTDIGILGKKLKIIDTTPKNGKSKIVFVAKDAGVDKGASGDPAQLEGEVQIYYVDNPSNESIMSMPLGDFDKNTDKIARYKNVTAPVGGEIKVGIVKPLKLIKVVAKDKGSIDISTNPAPGGVVTVVKIENGNDASTNRHCTLFSSGVGSDVIWKPIAGGTLGHKLTLKNGVGTICPDDCTDGVQGGTETDIDCGGATCPQCSPGQGCNGPADCTSGVCTGNICQAPTCSDGVQNQNETDVDCGGACGATCELGESCSVGGDCTSGSCPGGTCDCGVQTHLFTHNSNSGGVFDSAEWGGGTQQNTFSTGCTVTIQNPDDNIDLVCTLAAPFAVVGSTGFSSCFGTGGEDGDGCDVSSCPPAGFGECCSTRPSCSAALNGSGTATYFVQCNP